MALSLIATAHMITTISSSLQKELYQDGLIEGLLASIGDQAIQKKQISLLKDHLIPAGIQAGQLSSSSLELLFSASDLLLMAEKLSGEDSSLPEDYSSFKSSLKAKMAVKVRHDKVQAIKDQFIEHYHQALESGEKTTKTSIAIKFYHSLTTEQQVKLAPSRIEGNAVRTLTNALRKFEKSKIR